MVEKAIVFDLESIVNFITNETSKTEKKTEVTEVYSGEGATETLLTRQIRYFDDDKNDSNVAIRYDIVKNLMSILLDEKPSEITTKAEVMAYNTLSAHGFIKEI